MQHGEKNYDHKGHPVHELRTTGDRAPAKVKHVTCISAPSITMATQQWGKWHETLQLVGYRVRFKLDTGAQANVLPVRTYSKLKQAKPLQETVTTLVGFGSLRFYPLGTVKLCCSKENNESVTV